MIGKDLDLKEQSESEPPLDVSVLVDEPDLAAFAAVKQESPSSASSAAADSSSYERRIYQEFTSALCAEILFLKRQLEDQIVKQQSLY